MRVEDLEAIRIKLASPEDILSWSHGEVTKPETINYRTQRAEKDGLFCEKIFGPEKDYHCYCGKYRGVKYKGLICDRCSVEITKSAVRRERIGHIKLATPCSHIWLLRGVPSRIGTILDLSMQQLERVIFFAAHIITKVNEEAKKKILEEVEVEYKNKIKNFTLLDAKLSNGAKKSKLKNKKELKNALQELTAARGKAREEILGILLPLRVISEAEYRSLSLKYGEVFEAGTGAETIRKIFEKIDLKKEISHLQKGLENASPGEKQKILKRLRIFQAIERAGIRPEWMFLTVLPILPPDLRPMVQLDGGRYASSDLNDLYRRVINRNNRLKYLLEINAPEVILRNEKRMLQESVDALIDNGMRKGTTTPATTGGRRLLKSLADMLKGKQGRFRQNLLGKRVDYSGRSVIVVGPELKLHQCGLPKKMALELFKPFVIKKILERELAYNVRGASHLIEEETDEIWAILEEVVKDKLVLLNRAPTLHRLGVQAFYPVLIEGEAIRIHPLVCKAFNADFDGDQMAVHLPLSAAAQAEAKEIALSIINLLKPATGFPIVTLYQDIVLGCYWLTKMVEVTKEKTPLFADSKDAILAFEFGVINLREKIKVKKIKGGSEAKALLPPKGLENEFLETSVGRILFNEALPQDFPFQNIQIKIKELERIAGEIIKKYPPEKTAATLDRIKELGFEYSTLSGTTWGMDDLIVPPQKPEILQRAEKAAEEVERYFQKGLLSREEKRNKIIEIWSKAKFEIEKLVPQILPHTNPVFQIIDAGARGSWMQPVQMTGMKGLVINPAGQIIELPVKSSYKEGFDILEYFISTHGARKGAADTALRTSTAGYLTRRLVDVTHEVVVYEEDCGDEKGIEILKSDAEEMGQNFLLKIGGRVAAEDCKLQIVNGKLKKNKVIVGAGEIIDWEKAEKIIAAGVKKVRVRSPLSCQTIRGVCQKCYGWDLGRNQLVKLGEAVGISAAQSIGEPGTQLTMRTFHTGGVAGGGDITFGLPRVQEIFEARVPGGKAQMALADGKVLEITEKRIIKIQSDPLGGSRAFASLPPLSSQSPDGKSRKISKSKKKTPEIIEYQIPDQAAIWVNSGDRIVKGQQLCEGSLDLRELFKLAGSEVAQRYVLKEIQKIYVSQGAQIHDKHLEVIIRQMFSRVKIKEAGDSSFVPGTIVEKARFLEESARLKKEKKKPAEASQVLLGISRVALTTDSFLSAASFQETSRVLIKAAIEGKEDRLKGLKENSIIGKLIPAGTGFKKK